MGELLINNNQLNKNLIQDILKTYFVSTNISVFAIDQNGDRIINFQEDLCYCDFFKKCNQGLYPCKISHLNASKQAMSFGEAYIFFCPTGCIHFTIPIIKNNVFMGAVLGGPVLMNYPDEYLVDEIIKKYNILLDYKGKLLNSLKTIPVISPTKVRYLANLLYIVVGKFMPEEIHTLEKAHLKANQQQHINKNIQIIKKETVSSNYPYEKEGQLCIEVKNGNRIGANAILNELLGYIFFISGANLEIIKARITELCSILSRTVIENGADLDKIFGINNKYLSNLGKINDIEELSFLTIEIMERFMDNIFNLNFQVKQDEVIKKAIQYINDNYMKKITLETVAKHVYLSPAHFSTIFKKIVKMAFTDYLNIVRVDQSKLLLKNKNLSILDVALSVGFNNQSYYCKIFRKFTGNTPRMFRDAL